MAAASMRDAPPSGNPLQVSSKRPRKRDWKCRLRCTAQALRHEFAVVINGDASTAAAICQLIPKVISRIHAAAAHINGPAGMAGLTACIPLHSPFILA